MNEPQSDPVRRHVIISGGSRGLGKTLVEGLLAADYLVSTFSRNRTEFTDQLATNAAFFFEPADVCDPQTLSRFLDRRKGKVRTTVRTGELCRGGDRRRASAPARPAD